MCPEPQMLSVYLDGELPSPWDEKMEDHLSECSVCKQKLENLKKLQGLFKKNTHQYRKIVDKDGTQPDTVSQELEMMSASKERVWRKLESQRRFRNHSEVRRNYGLMRRKLSIPLPALAAAAVAVVVLVGALFIRGGITGQLDFSSKPNMILAEEDDMPGFIPASADMNGVLQYLDSEGAEIIILRLPESKNFYRSGDPVIMTADYSGSRP